jgi:thioesterase domain-containing protein
MVDEFTERILQLEPQGPYLLAGWSFGGGLAFEIARNLQRLGRQVALCVIFDTFCHGYPRQLSRRERWAAHWAHFLRRSPAENIRYFLSVSQSLGRTIAHRVLRLTGARQSDFFEYASPNLEQLVQVCNDAWDRCTLGPLAGRVALFRATQRPSRIGVSYEDPYNGWLPFVPDGIDLIPIDCNHVGFFSGRPVEEVSLHMNESIRAALSKNGTAGRLARQSNSPITDKTATLRGEQGIAAALL